jgi:MtN3 and saliva related transmembrane protein
MADMFAYAGGVILMFSYLPQVLKTWRAKTAKDLSLMMLISTLAQAFCFEVYAMILELTPVVIMNGVFLLLVGFQLGLKLYYGRSLGPTSS